MAEKVKIEVEVHVEKVTRGGDYETPDKTTSYKLLDVKLANGQPIPIPKDAPAPRRFHRELLAAAHRKLSGEPEPQETSANPRPNDENRTEPLGGNVVRTPQEIAREQARAAQQGTEQARTKTEKREG